MEITKLQKAASFASLAHNGIAQKRKYTGEDYIVHPESVVGILKEFGVNDEAMLCAAWLHDVVEDTPVSIQEIHAVFGDEVASLVNDLTNVTTSKDGNRSKRHQIEKDRISKTSAKAKTIKCADILDNISSIVEHDKDFAKIYIKEKIDFCEVLKEANSDIYEQLVVTLNQAKASL